MVFIGSPDEERSFCWRAGCNLSRLVFFHIHAASTSALIFAPGRFSAIARSYGLCKFSQNAASALALSVAFVGLSFERDSSR